MRWLKRNMWRAGITIAGILLLLILMVWVPVSAAAAYQRVLELTAPVTIRVQAATPTEDATITALNQEKLVWDITKDKSDIYWAWTASGTIVVGFLGAAVSYLQLRRNQREAQAKELKDRQNEREKRAEERFQSTVTGLGGEKEGARIGAAILLRTFLRPDYEQFYTQTFDLAVAHLRLSRTSNPPTDPNAPQPLTTLRQALIVVFKESFPLARSQEKKDPQFLDATGIQLDNAYLRWADLKQVWMPQASLRKADLIRADLNGAKLNGADLSEAQLNGADLREADLRGADLRGADLKGAKLKGAKLRRANLRGVKLWKAELSWVELWGDEFRRVDLSGADLSGADLSGVDLEGAILQGTDLRGVKGLTKERLEICKAKGAIIDEDTTTSSSRSPVSPPLPSQSNGGQAQSAPPARSTPVSDTGGSSATSSKPDPKL